MSPRFTPKPKFAAMTSCTKFRPPSSLLESGSNIRPTMGIHPLPPSLATIGPGAAPSLADHAVVVGVVHVLVCGMSTAHRSNAVVARLRAGDAAVPVVVVQL